VEKAKMTAQQGSAQRPTDAPGAATDTYGVRLDKQYFNFDAAHFLIFADGTREELHGHNYHVTVDLDAALDPAWMVADFLVVKLLVKTLLQELCHRTLLPTGHPLLLIETHDREIHAFLGEDRWILPRRDVRLLDIPNTSSESLCRWLCDRLVERLGQTLPACRIDRLAVSVQESPGQAAHLERRWTR